MIERSMAPLTDEHLHRLSEIAEEDREGMFTRNPHLASGFHDWTRDTGR